MNSGSPYLIKINKMHLEFGFSGVDNELYYNPKTMMLFGDAKDTITKLATAIKRQ